MTTMQAGLLDHLARLPPPNRLPASHLPASMPALPAVDHLAGMCSLSRSLSGSLSLPMTKQDCEGWRRRQAGEDDFHQFLARALAEEKVKSVTAERKQREDELALVVETIIKAEVEAEHARTWPDELTRELYAADVKAFAAWARERGLGFLPAQASTVAAHLIERAVEGGRLTLAELRQAAKAIIFAHELAQHFIDKAAISATLGWIAARYAENETTTEQQPEKQPPRQPEQPAEE